MFHHNWKGALHLAQDRDWFLTRLREGERYMRKPTCAAWSCDHCDRGVSIADRPHDPWLDSATAKLPAYPGLDYSAAINVVR
jgi:hypothetical protein